MQKLLLILIILFGVNNAYAAFGASNVAIITASNAAMVGSMIAFDQAEKQDSDNVQIEVAICNKMESVDAQSKCLIELKNKIKENEEEQNATLVKFMYFLVAVFVVLICLGGLFL